jgi:hypothetical protein
MYFVFIISLIVSLSGCVVVTAVSATAAVVGGAIDVVDAVTPDIFDDDDDDDDDDGDGDDNEL